MPQYKVLSSELGNAFDRAAIYMNQNHPKRHYTIESALRHSVGHDLRILFACRNVIRKSLEGKTVTDWLIANGVPEPEVRGLKGFKRVTAWKHEWMKRLANQFWRDSLINEDELLEFTYPF